MHYCLHSTRQDRRSFRCNALNSLKGSYQSISDSVCREYSVSTADGLSLIMHRITRNEARAPIILLHGLTLTGEMFSLPEIKNLTSFLLEHGFGDIWIPEWRGSGVYSWPAVSDNTPNGESAISYNIDDVALYDIPAIVEAVKAERPGRPVHIVSHCIGAMAVSMADVAGLLCGVDRIVCGNVGLLPHLKGVSWIKALFAADLIEDVLKLDRIPIDPAEINLRTAEAVIQLAANIPKTNCDSETCRLLSFAWGSGDESSVFQHSNLHKDTHDRLNVLFGPSSLSYLRHIKRMIYSKAVVRSSDRVEYIGLPSNYLNSAGRISSPTLLIAGTENRIWYDSIPRYFRFVKDNFPDRPVKLSMIDGYGHQDLFIGKNAADDVFPAIVDFLNGSIAD